MDTGSRRTADPEAAGRPAILRGPETDYPIFATCQWRTYPRFLARGGGVVLLHAACIADTHPEALAERTGLAAQPKRTKYRHGALDLTANAAVGHPITRGLRAAPFVDETYWPMIGDVAKVAVLATAEEEGESRPMLWTFTRGKGRVVGSVLGHYTHTLDDPLFRVLILRGLAWAAGEDVGRMERAALDEERGSKR